MGQKFNLILLDLPRIGKFERRYNLIMSLDVMKRMFQCKWYINFSKYLFALKKIRRKQGIRSPKPP